MTRHTNRRIINWIVFFLTPWLGNSWCFVLGPSSRNVVSRQEGTSSTSIIYVKRFGNSYRHSATFLPSAFQVTPRSEDIPTLKANKKLYSFVEARKLARGHGFSSLQEFLDYDCAGAYKLPKNADQVWASEWCGWDDFLGIPLSDYEEARQVTRTYLPQAQTAEQYMDLVAARKKLESNAENGQNLDNDLVVRLPYRPDLYYKSQWVGWDHFLGKES